MTDYSEVYCETLFVCFGVCISLFSVIMVNVFLKQVTRRVMHISCCGG